MSNDVGLTKAGPRAVCPGKSTGGRPGLLNPGFRGSPNVPSLGEGVNTCATGNPLSSGGHGATAAADTCSAWLGGEGGHQGEGVPCPLRAHDVDVVGQQRG